MLLINLIHGCMNKEGRPRLWKTESLCSAHRARSTLMGLAFPSIMAICVLLFQVNAFADENVTSYGGDVSAECKVGPVKLKLGIYYNKKTTETSEPEAVDNVTAPGCGSADAQREEKERARQEKQEKINLAKESYEECRSLMDGLREGVERCKGAIPEDICSTNPDGSWRAC